MMFQVWLQKLVDVRPNEVRALLWSFAYFFSILCAYYILRPMRDEMGILGGVKNLPWLFTATFVTLLVVIPFYSVLVTRLPRRKFIPIVYRFSSQIFLFSGSSSRPSLKRN